MVDDWLRQFDPPVLELTRRLRSLVRETIPSCEEALRPGWNLIGYRTRQGTSGRYFSFIAPREERVDLGFEWGSLLSDHHLLHPRGKQVKCYTAVPGADIPVEAIRALLREAAVLAELPAELRRERLAAAR